MTLNVSAGACSDFFLCLYKCSTKELEWPFSHLKQILPPNDLIKLIQQMQGTLPSSSSLKEVLLTTQVWNWTNFHTWCILNEHPDLNLKWINAPLTGSSWLNPHSELLTSYTLCEGRKPNCSLWVISNLILSWQQTTKSQETILSHSCFD